ncbi:ParB/RepB/Spo0J family partition protein [Mesorhizobium sp.]|uniref:ParB/RepB/Spo0J family partition protein n=1 Tax=Mesorhizobium sp. TaxID=1871066 RepID=UPI002579C90B|nr:ParB/RepB/Spo0J family partition protein [Mesorhizobium sp.]
MTLQTRTAALADLEIDDDINARRHRNDEGIEELKASIRAHGLAQSLRVRPAEKAGRFRIVAGSRRYRVLCELATSGDSAAGVPVTEEFPVPVIIGYEDDDQTAREISQAENFIRLPQHEADTYETFRELADRGLEEAQIAARFGIDVKRVRRMLALGRLSPMILAAWRDGTFEKFTGYNGSVADIVRAFTLAPSTEEQERVHQKLAKNGQLHAHIIRGEFGAGDRQIGKMLDLVGVKAYTAAGGSIVEDLFGENHAVSDPALVKKLVAEKLQAKVDEALKDGWSWAALADDLPSNWSWNWRKLGLSKKKATKAQKAESGAVVGLDYQYKLEITYGVVKPAAEKAAATKAERVKEKAAPTISNALHQRLSGQATLAVRQAIQQEPRVGLVALLAGLIAHRHLYTDSPVRVYHDGFGKSHGGEKESFASAFARLSDMSDQELFVVAAGCAGEAVHMERPYIGKPPFDANAAPLAAAINPKYLTGALQETFDAADYFGGASKPFVITAIREALNDDEARKAEKMKKAELTAFALANVPQTGWLPPELRAPTYSGPGAIPVLTEAPPTEPDDDDLVDEEVEEDEAA